MIPPGWILSDHSVAGEIGSSGKLIPAVWLPLVALPAPVLTSGTARCRAGLGVELADLRMGSTWGG